MQKSTLIQVTRHGETLLAIFPGATVTDPVNLCRKLRRLESRASKAATDWCNGEISSDRWESISDAIENEVAGLLGMSPEQRDALKVNGDPRGYGLKLRTEYTKTVNDALRSGDGARPIETDWGGYGILAPEFD